MDLLPGAKGRVFDALIQFRRLNGAVLSAYPLG
jgi:hypothetical protein